MQDMITADAVKSFSRGHTWTHKDYSWYLLKTCCLAWHKSNLLAVLQVWEYTESTKPGGKVASPRLMFPGHSMEPAWPAMTDGVLRHQRPMRQSLYPTDCVWKQQWTTYKERRGERGGICEKKDGGDAVLGNRLTIPTVRSVIKLLGEGSCSREGVSWHEVCNFDLNYINDDWSDSAFCFNKKVTFYVSQMRNENVLKC